MSLFYRVLCFLCNSEAFWHTLTRVHTHPLARQWYVGHLNNTVGPLPGHQTHDTPPHSLTTKTGKKIQRSPALLHHYCFSSLIVKVKRMMKAKLEVTPLGEMNLAFWKREQCVWVQPAEGSLLSQTYGVLCHGGLVCLSSICQTHTHSCICTILTS